MNLIETPHTAKPTIYQARIDRFNPLTPDYAFAFAEGEGLEARELVKGILQSTFHGTDSSAWVASKFGNTFRLVQASTQYIDYGTFNPIVSRSFTVACRIKPSSAASSWQNAFSNRNPSNLGFWLAGRPDTFNATFDTNFWLAFDNVIQVVSTPGTFVQDSWISICVRGLPSSTEIYFDGSLDTSSGASALPSSSSNPFLIGAENTGTPGSLYGGLIDHLYFWTSKALPPDAIRKLAAEPYSVFEPRRVMVGFSGGGGVSVAPPAATGQVLGVDPSVVQGPVSVTAPFAAAQALAQDPSLILGSVISSPAVAQAIANGIDPGVNAGGVTIAPANAAAIAAAVDPAIRLGSIVIQPAASQAAAVSVDPTTGLGSLVVTPAVAQIIAQATDPIAILGALILGPAPADGLAAAIDPQVTLGAVILSPAAAQMVARALDPATILEALSVSPGFAQAGVAALDPVSLVELLITIDIEFETGSYTLQFESGRQDLQFESGPQKLDFSS